MPSKKKVCHIHKKKKEKEKKKAIAKQRSFISYLDNSNPQGCSSCQIVKLLLMRKGKNRNDKQLIK